MPAARPTTSSNRSHLAVVLGAAVVTLVADLVAAWFSGSLALLADAAHRTTDVVAISVALVAATIAARPATAERTFGHARAEVIAACVNAGILFAMGMFVGYEALTRLFSPEVPDPAPMALASLIGLGGAGVSFLVMRTEHAGFAARGAFLDVVGDAVGSIAALAAAGLIATERLSIADPVASLAVTALVVPRAVLLLRDAVNVLMESTPPGASLPAIRARILAVPGVVEVHDLHAWQISAGLPVITAHVALRRGVSQHSTVTAIDACLAADFDVEHSTIQVDPVSHDREGGAHD